ncbi:MAG: hypothetical protein OEZ39_03595 [Gammaproteobacteria bacterium]|nr:hypothetical protein [Gammaproteobacteria bacterium]MDH5650940.1 hypothetical protein [Gammaproteobacteria bacterium]
MQNIWIRPGLATFVWFVLFILLESLLTALATGAMPGHLSSWIHSAGDLYVTLFWEAPGRTLQLTLFDKPLFVVSNAAETSARVWSLHYYAGTILLHGILAWFCARTRVLINVFQQPGLIPGIAGICLLLIASLYLQIAACCTGGPIWIIHSMTLALIFNPATATVRMIEIYQSVSTIFPVMQWACAAAGGYLLYRYRQITKDNPAENCILTD